MTDSTPHPERLVRREERRVDDGRRLIYYTFEPAGPEAAPPAPPAPPAQAP
ncbi:MAG: hypothetical protein VKQ33_12720 [Candidatus Sericytochromatia bacterium]|nr:hypothetical protein [Candidatus Sericytochromatia bacterium]